MEITKEQVLENIELVKKYITESEQKKEEKVVGIAIKNRFTGDIIFQSTKTTYKDAVKECVELANKNYTRADLTRANLTGAKLTDAELTRANLTGAKLTDADLTGAKLTGAKLTDADLTGANLTDTDLTGCLFYFGNGNRNFEALCRAIKTIKHVDGRFEDLVK